jgi:cadmium resistance protein CadD (predicted permease)
MSGLFSAAGSAALLFAGTNVDDSIVLALLNASSRADGRPTRWQIWLGQYLGVAVLATLSLIAALGLTLIPDHWLWLLGWIPLLLGLHKLSTAIHAHNTGETISPAAATGLTGVIGLTIANGGDNLAAYTPIFRTLTTADTAVTLAVFTIGVALWCCIGALLVSHRKITHVIQQWGHWIVPAVFILIGLYVFEKGGAFG